MAGSITSGTVRRPPPPPIEHGWGNGGAPGGPGSSRRASLYGIFLLIASSVMAFAAFTVAFVVRRFDASDWVSTPKPHILWFNTAVLVTSSFLLDRSRRALRNRNRAAFNRWWTWATALGLVFLAGQAIAWLQLRAAGFYVATGASTSFFYLLTAFHAFHLTGGLGALIYVDVQAWRLRLGPGKRTAIDVSAIFWHFLDAVWLYLMVLLYLWG